MASLRDIRMRIRSVKNTQQITKAMKMVAAAKLRRAQDAITAARPYAKTLDQMIADLAARAEGEVAHPLLVSRPVKNAEVIVMTSDRGLAGGFNSNMIRKVSRFLFENQKTYPSINLSVIGRKGNEFFRKRPDVTIRRYYEGYFAKANYVTAQEIAQEMTTRFLRGEVDAVFLAFNEFQSAISQTPKIVQLLPMAFQPEAGAQAPVSGIDYKYEPSREAVLEKLIPQALTIKVLRAMLESFASFQGAQMSAMENATKNAGDMIGRLTLFYNRSRQALITKELMEIVSGAEALK